MSVYSLLHFDFDVHAGWQAEVHQVVDCFGSRLGDIYQPLVRTHLKLLASVLVDMRARQYSDLLLIGRQRHWPGYLSASADSRVDDLFGRLVDDLVVIGLEFDTDSLFGDSFWHSKVLFYLISLKFIW